MDGFDAIAYINTPRWRSSNYGLERITYLLHELGDPQRRMRIVHVAGTNGKGSTCAYTAEILRCAGYRTGLFTSPYIVEFTDRIRIDGANVGLPALTRATLAVRDVAEAMDDHPTEFELMTAVAFACFAEAGCEVAVVEVGLGGRLDSTNVVQAPDVCAITPIDFDHTELLGDTLAAIAGEKAGIIKPGATVVMAKQPPEAAAVIRAKAAEAGCELREVGSPSAPAPQADEEGAPAQRFDYGAFAGLSTRLLGSYQPQNAAAAVEIALALRDRGLAVGDDAVRRGIAQTTWPGRFQLAARDPLFIVDGGHNPQGAAALAQSLELHFPGRRAVLMIGLLADKDYRPMLARLLPFAQAVVCVAPPNPRALQADELARVVAELLPAACPGSAADVPVEAAASIAEGVSRARQLAGADGLVVACGSLYSVSAVLAEM